MYRLIILISIIVLGGFVYTGINNTINKDKIRRKIRKSITLQLIFLTFISFSFITIFLHDNSYMYQRDKMLAIANAKAAHIEGFLEHAGKDVSMMAAGNAYKSFFNTQIDLSERISQINERIETTISSHGEFEVIKIVSRDGYILVSNEDDEGEYIGDLELFRSGLIDTHIDNPMLCESSDCKVLPISSPILFENEIKGVLITYINIDSIEEITMATESLGKNGEIILFNEQNYAINRLRENESKDLVPLGEDFASELKELLASDKEKPFIETLDYSGTNTVATITKIEGADWYLLVQMDYIDMLNPIFLIIALQVLVIIFVVILGRIGSKRIANKIAVPIEELTDNVNVVIKGDFAKKVVIDSPDEVGTLSKDIDNMTQVIIDSQKDLDMKIASQTKLLAQQREQLSRQQLALLNILEDVKDEKEEIDRQRNKLDIILDGIGDGVFAVDKDFVITRFNGVATQITGFSQEEVVGKKCRDILQFRRESDDSLYYDFIINAIEKGKIQNMANHTYVVRKDGSKVAVADSAAPIKNEDGEVLGCVVVFRDVTIEREVNKMKDEFVSVASHQLRTPLTGIKWYLQLLSKEDKGELAQEQREYIKAIYDSNERMIKLVDDLLSVSRIDTGRKFEIRKKKVNIVQEFKMVIDRYTVIARQRGIKIVCQKDCPTKLMVNADPDKLSEVFANIVSNAVKYSKDKGKVEISVSEEKEDYVFAVKDSGLGIPKDQQDKIFEKFFRAENVKKHQVEGNGLGLYIARSIIEAHNGKIWFKSQKDKGTTFYISIPKA